MPIRLLRAFLAICLALLGGAACASINPQTFSAIDRAGLDIVAAFGERATLPKFVPLRQNYSSALNELRPRVQSSKERALLGDYVVVDERLSEMLSVWEGLTARREELLPVSRPAIEQLKRRYDLPVNTNEPISIYAAEALVALRDDITQRLNAAHDALK